jgi:hypothetical protein
VHALNMQSRPCDYGTNMVTCIVVCTRTRHICLFCSDEFGGFLQEIFFRYDLIFF